MKSVRVWDLPLRIFHWLLAAAVAAAVVSGQIGGNLMTWHGRLGILIAGLIGFRLAWGLVGSTHSRFASFVRGPGAVLAYLRGDWRGLGHNPLGALSVLGLIGVVGLQTAGGLFGNDDIAFQGPLYNLVSKETSDWITGLHRKGFWLVGLLVALHGIGHTAVAVGCIADNTALAGWSKTAMRPSLIHRRSGTGCAWAVRPGTGT